MSAPRVLAETTLSLPQAAARLGVGFSSVRRWTAAGVKRRADGVMVRLETAKRGGARVTSVEAIERFHEALNAAEPAAPQRTPAQARRASARASAELTAAGW